jgi:SAM-dependent methyltransferase
MSLVTYVRNALYETGVGALDVDGADLITAHRRILERKVLLRSAFTEFYRDMSEICEHWLPARGLEIELGSGVGFFKHLRPNLITSDVRPIPGIDRVIDAQQMDLPDETVRCIYAINAFHHLPDPERFLWELCRVLKPGGGCILIEPHNGLGSRLLHRYMHKDEHFDPKASSWKTEEIRGPMSGANQALSYIIFERDRKKFEEGYGRNLEVVCRFYCLNGLRYFFSGGLNFRQLLPSFTEPLLRALEQLGRSFAKHWSFHQVVVLRKR